MGIVIDLVLRSRPRDLGGFAVRRTLPSAQRRLVGPFIFWDHMGPVSFDPGNGMDVRPHPHIGLSTVTYLFEGEAVHKDSLGSDQTIRPGAVNWMTAGRGIAHSERSSAEGRKSGSRVHGIQSWVALPLDQEEVEPRFQHVAAELIPETAVGRVRLRVLLGEAYGLESPAGMLWPTFYVEANMDAGARLAVPAEYEERAAYVVQGAVNCGGVTVGEGEMGILGWDGEGGGGDGTVLDAQGPSRVMLLGGARLEGARHIWWNFVSSSEARIERAKRDWKEGAFGKIPGDDVEFVPLPE